MQFQRSYLAAGAMAFAGLMTCIPTMPASAEVAHETAPTYSRVVGTDLKSIAPLPLIERAGYAISYFSMVQYPVPPNTDISDGFGYRVPPCYGCSSYHDGVDYLPGFGAPVKAMANGVVTEIGNEGGLGVHLTISHSIDGQLVTSTYGHLIYGSIPLSLGQSVGVGQVVGKTGDTGQSTGPHLHLEIHVAGGIAVDPVGWLAQHVNG